MNARQLELENLLEELTELGAAAEEKGISSPPPLTPYLQKARDLGVAAPADASLDGLRDAVEAACAAGGADAGSPISAREIFGNEKGIPGDGP
jgi:hypothetical protein